MKQCCSYWSFEKKLALKKRSNPTREPLTIHEMWFINFIGCPVCLRLFKLGWFVSFLGKLFYRIGKWGEKIVYYYDNSDD